jgi:hypothetical protein
MKTNNGPQIEGKMKTNNCQFHLSMPQQNTVRNYTELPLLFDADHKYLGTCRKI